MYIIVTGFCSISDTSLEGRRMMFIIIIYIHNCMVINIVYNKNKAILVFKVGDFA